MYNEIEQLKNIGCEEIKQFTLINNYGYKFRKNGYQHTLSHYLKDNGEDVNYWTIWRKVFTSFEDALEFIKQL